MRKTFYILRFCFLCVIALFVGKTNAQVKITGTVLDSISKQALPAANITLFSKGNISTPVKIVTTNKKGEYRFNDIIKGDYFININYIGYLPGTIQNIAVLDNTTAVLLPAVRLSLNNVKLKDVTVTGKVPFIVHSVDKTTVNIAESAISAGGNALEVLQRAPGVRVDENGNVTLNSKAVMMFVDGRPTYVTGEDLKNLLSAMPASAIDKLELIDNPGVKYDASAEAVINIKSLKGRNYGWNGTVNAGIGSGKFLRYNTGVTFNNRGRKYNFYGGYDYARSKWFAETQNNRLIDNIGYKNYVNLQNYKIRKRNVHNLKIGLDIEPNKKTSYGVLLKGTSTMRTNNSNKVIQLGQQYFSADSFTRALNQGDFKILNPTINVYFKKTLDKTGNSISFNGDYLYTNRHYLDDYSFNYFNKTYLENKQPDYNHVEQPSVFKITAVSIDFSHPGKVELDAGLKYVSSLSDNNLKWQKQQSGIWVNDPGRTNHFIYKENVSAAYLNAKYKYKKWAFQAGLRSEYTKTIGNSITINQKFSKDFVDFFPQFSIYKEFKNESSLKLSFRKSIKRFGYDYVNPFITSYDKYSYSQGNINLKPQYRYTYTLNYNYKGKLNLQLYYAAGKDELSLFYRYKDTSNTALIGYYDNFNTLYKYAFSVDYQLEITKKVVADIGYEGVRSGFVLPKNNLGSPIIGHGFYLNLSWRLKNINFDFNSEFSAPYRNEIYNDGIDYSYTFGSLFYILNKKLKVKISLRDFISNFSNFSEYKYLNAQFKRIRKSDTQSMNISIAFVFGKKSIKESKNRTTGLDLESQRINNN